MISGLPISEEASIPKNATQLALSALLQVVLHTHKYCTWRQAEVDDDACVLG
jgi:hypothetical protein